MDTSEHARESMEHARHQGPADGFARSAALLIAALAAMLALAELGAQSAQTEYVSRNIAVSNDWTFYGFKETRARLAEQTTAILRSLPGVPDQGRQDALAAASATVQRMRDGDASGPGTRQINETAKRDEEAREHALHRYHFYEYASGALQIAIVLASAAIVTRIKPLLYGGGCLGLLGAALALATRGGLL